MRTTVAGIELQNPLMNAAYIGSKNREDIDKLINSSCGAVVVGSITIKPRDKNPGKSYWRHKDGLYSLNSYGMPNGGIEYFRKELPLIIKSSHSHNKPVIVNVAGFSNEEFVNLIYIARSSGADIVELNLGCPNVWEEDLQKNIMSYHPKLIKELLTNIRKSVSGIKLALKISPLPPDILHEVATIITDSKIVDIVVATNSYPNASVSSGTRIENEDDLVGMTGRALKPISLGVVKQLRVLLPESIDIIGCGGISSINDVNDYLSAGAKAVQIATALVDDGLETFDRLKVLD